MTTLPTLGLGLSSNAQQGDFPRPYELLRRFPGLFDYLEYSAPLDVAEAAASASLWPQMLAQRAQVPLLYHPVHLNLFGPELESPERLALAAAHVQAVGSPWVSNDVGWWHHRGLALPGYLYLSPPLTVEALAAAAQHVAHVRDAMPVPLLIENPVVLQPRGPLHVLEFMARLSDATGCPLLLDVGHLVSHQLARGLPLDAGFEGVPWERVAQLHVAGGVVTADGAYADDHPQPVRDETWAVLALLLKRCTQLKAVTYEGDGHPDAVARRNLERLRLMCPLTPCPAPSPAGEGRGEGQQALITPITPAQTTLAWSTFRDAHRTPGAERDYRLTLVAQELDATVPLTRAAVAPTRARLGDFLASDAFEGWFHDAARPLPDAFQTWALTESRRPELEGADALVSLELWARALLSRARRTGATHVDAVFAVDLTEAVHAAHALRRHLTGRGLDDAKAWEGLLQCARRAPPASWQVRLEGDQGRVRISGREEA